MQSYQHFRHFLLSNSCWDLEGFVIILFLKNIPLFSVLPICIKFNQWAWCVIVWVNLYVFKMMQSFCDSFICKKECELLMVMTVILFLECLLLNIINYLIYTVSIVTFFVPLKRISGGDHKGSHVYKFQWLSVYACTLH